MAQTPVAPGKVHLVVGCSVAPGLQLPQHQGEEKGQEQGASQRQTSWALVSLCPSVPSSLVFGWPGRPAHSSSSPL